MNNAERIKMVKAMEYIARQINDEPAFEPWLIVGVADGDIKYGDLESNLDDDLVLDYCDDETFADLMDTFLYVMKRASKGGLYCDGIISKPLD